MNNEYRTSIFPSIPHAIVQGKGRLDSGIQTSSTTRKTSQHEAETGARKKTRDTISTIVMFRTAYNPVRRLFRGYSIPSSVPSQTESFNCSASWVGISVSTQTALRLSLMKSLSDRNKRPRPKQALAADKLMRTGRTAGTCPIFRTLDVGIPYPHGTPRVNLLLVRVHRDSKGRNS